MANMLERWGAIAHLEATNIEHALFAGRLYFVAQLSDGRFVAYSNDTPYFCLTAATRHEARDLGVAALREWQTDPTRTAGALE